MAAWPSPPTEPRRALQLAWASDTTLAAVIPKLGKSKTLQQAVQRAREIAGSSDPAAASLPAADTPVPAATADAMAAAST